MFYELCPVFLRKLGIIFEIEAAVGIDTLMQKKIRALLERLTGQK